MKNKSLEKSLNWDAHYVGICRLVKRQRNYITLDEVALEAARQLYRFVPITIEDQIPVFTEWVVKDLKLSTKSRKNNFLSKRRI